ncbi:trigger factor [Chloroflexota bacterium]
MNVTREKTENRQEFLTIEMEPAEVEEAREKAYHRLVKKTNVPGFRKGKAPREVLERYVGEDSLLEDALNTLVPEAYEKAIKEQEIDAIAQPQIEIAQTDPVVFKAIVPLRPTVELGDYQQIQVTPEPVEITEADVDAVIEQLRHQHATWEPAERPVELNDLVVLDIDSSVEDEPFINRKGAQFQIVQDATFPAPGFSEQLLGMAGGEEREFNLEFPADYPRDELAGKKASFKVTVHEMKQERLPELSDEFAQEVNSEFKTMDTLREQVSTNLKLRAEEKVQIDFEERVIDAVVDLTQVEFPPILENVEIERLLEQEARRWQTGGRGMDEYLRSINKTQEDLWEELRPLAIKRVTRSLVLGKIAEEEKVEVSDAEIDAEIENMIQGAGENGDELGKLVNTPQSREAIRQSLMPRKTIQRLLEIAQGTSSGENQVAGQGDILPGAEG